MSDEPMATPFFVMIDPSARQVAQSQAEAQKVRIRTPALPQRRRSVPRPLCQIAGIRCAPVSLSGFLGKQLRQLLQRFVAQADEEAFARLVHRHGAMVLGVCRHVLHGHHRDDLGVPRQAGAGRDQLVREPALAVVQRADRQAVPIQRGQERPVAPLLAERKTRLAPLRLGQRRQERGGGRGHPPGRPRYRQAVPCTHRHGLFLPNGPWRALPGPCHKLAAASAYATFNAAGNVSAINSQSLFLRLSFVGRRRSYSKVG